MRAPSYCFKSLESIFYFRMRIPTDLQPIFNRTELKKSLRTKNESVALRRCRHYVTAAENVFESLRLKLFRAELDGDNANLQELSLPEASSTAVTTRDKEKELWNTVFNADKGSRQNTAQVPPLPETSPGIHLGELIQLYINEVTSQRGQTISQGIEKNLLRFLEIVTDKPLDQYGIEDRQRYRDVLQRLPKCVNRTKYKGMSILEVVKTDIPPDERLSVKTVNMRLIEVATLFNWAVNNNLVGSHPFKNAVLKIQQNDDTERPAISDDDIRKIIENLPKSAEEPSKYWVPLIACFTGMRQSEIAQLDGEDIVDRDGIWCIDINDRGDKRLKNGNARRIVPLHPMLLRAGLVEFAKKRSGQKMLADVIPYNGKYGHQVSKDFAKYRALIGVEGDGQTFHGIRHSVISKLWSAGIPEAHTAAVVGHQRGERESYIRYAKKNDLRPLLAAIKAIDYGNIEITAW